MYRQGQLDKDAMDRSIVVQLSYDVEKFSRLDIGREPMRK